MVEKRDNSNSNTEPQRDPTDPDALKEALTVLSERLGFEGPITDLNEFLARVDKLPKRGNVRHLTDDEVREVLEQQSRTKKESPKG